jgi:hypothetical protein
MKACSMAVKNNETFILKSKRRIIMETLIQEPKGKIRESFQQKNDLQTSKTEKNQHKSDPILQKDFRVVDLWKIRNMKKYFNYQ